MGRERVERSQPCGQRVLSPRCLPVSPASHEGSPQRVRTSTPLSRHRVLKPARLLSASGPCGRDFTRLLSGDSCQKIRLVVQSRQSSGQVPPSPDRSIILCARRDLNPHGETPQHPKCCAFAIYATNAQAPAARHPPAASSLKALAQSRTRGRAARDALISFKLFPRGRATGGRIGREPGARLPSPAHGALRILPGRRHPGPAAACAPGRPRTSTIFQPPAPQAGASANSATGARNHLQNKLKPVDMEGVEPSASPVRGECSPNLSYMPKRTSDSAPYPPFCFSPSSFSARSRRAGRFSPAGCYPASRSRLRPEQATISLPHRPCIPRRCCLADTLSRAAAGLSPSVSALSRPARRPARRVCLLLPAHVAPAHAGRAPACCFTGRVG